MPMRNANGIARIATAFCRTESQQTGAPTPRRADGAGDRAVKIGSEAHKQLFCGTFFDQHRPYEAEQLEWPRLGEEALRLLRSLPFWTHALQAEEDAGPMIRACAALEPDPLVRQALELQAFEETRHARIIKHMTELYCLHV